MHLDDWPIFGGHRHDSFGLLIGWPLHVRFERRREATAPRPEPAEDRRRAPARDHRLVAASGSTSATSRRSMPGHLTLASISNANRHRARSARANRSLAPPAPRRRSPERSTIPPAKFRSTTSSPTCPTGPWRPSPTARAATSVTRARSTPLPPRSPTPRASSCSKTSRSAPTFPWSCRSASGAVSSRSRRSPLAPTRRSPTKSRPAFRATNQKATFRSSRSPPAAPTRWSACRCAWGSIPPSSPPRPARVVSISTAAHDHLNDNGSVAEARPRPSTQPTTRRPRSRGPTRSGTASTT